jgi:hypothetical protein
MTAGLLTSRQNKNSLFKLQLAENTPQMLTNTKSLSKLILKLSERPKNFISNANFKKTLATLKKLGTH